MEPRTTSEKLFVEYLDSNEVKYEYEVETAAGKRPDFLIHHHNGKTICEVTEIDVQNPQEWAPTDFRERVRTKIKEKAKQAKGLTETPFVIVIWEPLSFGWYDMIPEAMFGDRGVTIDIGLTTGEQLSELRNAFLGGGRLQRKRNTRISAVAGMRLLNPTQRVLEDRIDAKIEQEERRLARTLELEELLRSSGRVWPDFQRTSQRPSTNSTRSTRAGEKRGREVRPRGSSHRSRLLPQLPRQSPVAH